MSLPEPPKLSDPSENAAAEISSALIADVRALVNAARHRVAQAINAELVLLYWGIGNRIRRDILGEERAGYGEQIVSTLSRQLTSDYAGFSRPNLFHMIRLSTSGRTGPKWKPWSRSVEIEDTGSVDHAAVGRSQRAERVGREQGGTKDRTAVARFHQVRGPWTADRRTGNKHHRVALLQTAILQSA